MANSYSSPNFNVDTSCNIADLITLKGSALASTDVIYVYAGATLTCEQSFSCLKIYLGQTSGGAATGGQRYGGLIFNAGITVTFTGNATATNSGVQSFPTSADSSSLNNFVQINGSASSYVTLTNSVGANNTSNKYIIDCRYGSVTATCVNINYQFGTVFNISLDNTRCNSGSKVNFVNIGVAGTNTSFIVAQGTRIDYPGDFRFNTVDCQGNFVYIFFAGTASQFFSGGSIDFSGCSWSNSAASAADVQILNVEGKGAAYVGQCRVSYDDIRNVSGSCRGILTGGRL